MSRPRKITSSHSNRRTHRRAFTFVELCLGLVITSLITAAVASFMWSVSGVWNATEEMQSATIRANQFTERLSRKLRDAKLIGTWHGGSVAVSARVLYWRDLNNDGVITYSELGAIVHDPNAQTIDLYVASLDVGDPDPPWTTAAFTDAAAITNFIVGLTPQPMAQNVSSAEVGVSNATTTDVAPTVVWSLGLSESNSTVVTRICSATLRGPATPP